MPYKLRKAPNRNLYWVVTTETGRKHSKDPIPLDKAKAQMRILESALVGSGAVKEVRNKRHPKYIEIQDMDGNFLDMVETKEEAAKALTKWYKLSPLEVIYEVDKNMALYNNIKPITPKIYYILDSLVTSVKTLSEKFLSSNHPEDEKEQIRDYLHTEIPIILKHFSSPQMSKESLGFGKSCGKPPYHDYSKGKANVFVLGCIDPRYAYDVAYFLQHKKELHQDYDLFTLPGASLGADQKDWKKTFFDVLKLGLDLHGIKEVWCFDHLDCGMYKATLDLETDMDPKIHIKYMDKLKKEIKKKHPQLKFRQFIVDAKGHINIV